MGFTTPSKPPATSRSNPLSPLGPPLDLVVPPLESCAVEGYEGKGDREHAMNTDVVPGFSSIRAATAFCVSTWKGGVVIINTDLKIERDD